MHGALFEPPRERMTMLTEFMGLLSFGASVAVVVWGAVIRRDMDHARFQNESGMIPAGAAQEAS